MSQYNYWKMYIILIVLALILHHPPNLNIFAVLLISIYNVLLILTMEQILLDNIILNSKVNLSNENSYPLGLCSILNAKIYLEKSTTFTS